MLTLLDYMEYSTDESAQSEYAISGYHPITFNGTAQLDTAVQKWGSASLLLDGDSDYLTIPDSTDWDIIGSNSDDWTVDFWVKHIDHAGSDIYFSVYDSVNGYRYMIQHTDGSGLQFVAYNGSWIISGTAGGEITDTDWHHIAMCKVGQAYGVYKDDVQVYYATSASTLTTDANLCIGWYEQGGDYYFNGHIDDLRIQHSNIFGAAPVIGLTNTITKPTSAHEIDTDTKLLLHFNGLDEAVATKDSSRCEPYSESTIKTQGSYSLKAFAKQTDSLNDTLTRTVSPTIDLSGLTQIKFDIRASRTGSNIKIGIHDSGGTTTEVTPNILSPNTWQEVKIDLQSVINANKDAIDSIIITIVNADADNTIYIDNLFGFYISLISMV